MSASAWIVSTTDATFEADVLAASRERPVIVDFWATWCQPCLLLAPLLEKLANEYAGKFLLVKAETEANSSAAAQFQVSGIPALFAVVHGEVVDFQQGLAPEAQLRAFIDRQVQQFDLQAVAQLAETDPGAAEPKLRELAEQSPQDAQLQILHARALLGLKRSDDARAILEKLEARGFLEPEAQTLKSQLELAGMSGDLTQLEAQAADPKNLDAQLAYAKALASAGRHEDALQRALAIISIQKTGPGEAAKQLMLDIFRVLPADSDLTGTYRRKLASTLY